MGRTTLIARPPTPARPLPVGDGRAGRPSASSVRRVNTVRSAPVSTRKSRSMTPPDAGSQTRANGRVTPSTPRSQTPVIRIDPRSLNGQDILNERAGIVRVLLLDPPLRLLGGIRDEGFLFGHGDVLSQAVRDEPPPLVLKP